MIASAGRRLTPAAKEHEAHDYITDNRPAKLYPRAIMNIEKLFATRKL